MDHPCDHINGAVLPAVPLEEPVRVAASTSVSPDIQAPSFPQDTAAFQLPSHSQHEDYLPQLTQEQKEDLMHIHTELTSQENLVNQVYSFEFEEPRDRTDDYNAIFMEPQGKSDDSKSTSEEEFDQEEWMPQGKRKQGKSKSNVRRKYTKRNSAKTQGGKGSGPPKLKRKYTKQNSAKTQGGEGSGP